MPRAWTAFRNGGGVGDAPRGIPLRWSPRSGIAWKTALPGYGQSSPVVWGGRVFATCVQGPQRERCLVHACDLRTGKLLWSRSFASSLPHEMSYYVSRAAPSPAVDSRAVYVFFESGELAALGHDGRVLWQRALVREYGAYGNEFGIGHSLAQNADTLFVLVDDPAVAYLIAVDKRTGRNRWKVERPPRKSWTSPVATRQGRREMVLVSANGDVDAYAAESGEPLWSVGRITGNIMPSPSVDGDRVHIGATPAQARLARPGGRGVAASNCCLRLFESGGKPAAEVLWEGEKATCDFASPLPHRGIVHSVTAAGIAYAVDAATGKTLYAERIESPCWASPLALGDHVCFFGKNGAATVIKAGPRFEKVAVNRLWSDDDPPLTSEPFATTPNNPAAAPPRSGNAAPGGDPYDPILYAVAAVDGRLVARLGSHLVAIG